MNNRSPLGPHAGRRGGVLSVLPLTLLVAHQSFARLPGAEAGSVTAPAPPVPMVATRVGDAEPGPRPAATAPTRPCEPAPGLVAVGALRRIPAPAAAAVERSFYPPGTLMNWRLEGNPEIAAMAGAITRVIARNVVQYPGARAPYFGVVPGDYYPEVYIRDLATAGRALQYLYGPTPLRGALEEFLARVWTEATPDSDLGKIPYPGPDSLPGYLAPDGRAVKTTATSDEEASAVQLAYLHFRNGGGSGWLGCPAGGRTVLQRLNAAMERLFLGRLDAGTGLIRRGHTTDWGDVRFQAVADHTRSDPEGERWAASIHDQAWTYLALLQLADMNEAAAHWEAASRWRREAVRLRANVQRFLWQPDRGFFRLHLHLLPWRHPFDEDAMVAIGNAVAVYAGLADPDQAPSIFDALERARVQRGVSKPGLSLHPPYPEGFFVLPHMYHEGHYQNGGVWDWWGGVQITAEFEHGASEAGFAHLLQVARDWAPHTDPIGEWQLPLANRREGSPNYAGAAGTMSEAVIRGLFGVHLDAAGFAMSPRLGGRSGEMEVAQPATESALWLRHEATPQALKLAYDARHRHPGSLRLRLPADADAASASFDGRPVATSLLTAGLDRYLDFGGVPPGAHRAEVRLTPWHIPALAAQATAHVATPVVAPGGVVRGTVTLQNAGVASWHPGGPAPIRVGLRWFHEQGTPVDGAVEARAQLPRPVPSGQSVIIPFGITAPRVLGDLRLQVDALHEHVTWFHEVPGGNRAVEAPVRVTANAFDVQWLNVERCFAVRAGRPTTLELAGRNSGTAHWSAAGAQSVRLALRWYDASGRRPQEPGVAESVTLPGNAAPGEHLRWDAAVRVPTLPGAYTMHLELVGGPQPGFVAGAGAPARIAVTVEP